ncbi:armadillo-type protein, partial [Neohortaea acidophila]
DQLNNINQALHATLDPRVSNEVRQQALEFLEQVKHQPAAPHHGFTLADDWKQNDAVRYYGLQLLEHAVRHRWPEYTPDQTTQLRTWVKCLAGSIREQDVLYIRNKIAQLWVEVAKRCWGDEWVDMDALLVTLWDKPLTEKGTANKILVLYVLEILSEDIINNEDAVAGLRLDVLGDSLNEIMVPADLYAEMGVPKAGRELVRSGNEGWLARVCGFFATCVKSLRVGGNPAMLQSMSFCAIKALHALRPAMTWVSLKAAVGVNAVDCIFLAFHTDDVTLQTAATEALYALLNRPYGQHWHDSWLCIFQQALQPDGISLIRQIFERAQSPLGEDDYTLQKKLSEVLSILAEAIARHPELVDAKMDLPAFFDLLLQVLQSKSLVVSIPVLYSWTKLMGARDSRITDYVFQALGPLVQICSSRLLRYEAISESDESEDEVIQLLNDDFDTTPERHAFLGNYRRYCVSIIQTIARVRPMEALSHVLGQIRDLLYTGPYTFDRGFDSERYSKTSLPSLQFEAQYQLAANTLKGFQQWLADVATVAPEDELHTKVEEEKAAASDLLRRWSHDIVNAPVDDPEVAELIVQMVTFVLRTIKPEPASVLEIVIRLLAVQLQDRPAHTAYSDAIKSFEALRVIELQKLALAFADDLLEVYGELESRCDALVRKHADDARLVWGYKAFLFMIVYRAKGIDNSMRLGRLQQMLSPVYEAWQEPSLSASVTTLSSFCQSLGLGNLPDFYRRNRFDQISDWATQQLDDAGQARQAEIRAKGDALPIRMTKSMLAATIEKLGSGTEEFEIACQLWSGIIPVILPNLLQLLRHAQAFHNMSNWSQLPEELQMVIKRTLQDRFWQSGISSESKDEFYARISGSKTSYEGFASAVRGTMRNIREQGYHMLYLMTKFEEPVFGIPDLAPSLAEALFADADALSANQLHPLINLMTGIVQRCPPHHRKLFLPPLLTQLFHKFDKKISSEWEALGQASHQNAEDAELSEEMRVESVLRHLTYSMVSFVTFLLEFDTPPQQSNGHGPVKPSRDNMVLSDLSILEHLMLFCTHALRMRDTRCCTTICRVFRSIIPLFQSDDAPPAPQVRDFISTEVLKACITSLNEPYFSDMQKDLAALIAQILSLYSPRTNIPRDILLSLPAMTTAKVDKALGKIGKAANERQQRALVLNLLDGVRGVSIYEAGKIVPLSAAAPKKSKVLQQYM